MADPNDPLSRIADALQRLAPTTASATDWLSAPAYLWNGSLGILRINLRHHPDDLGALAPCLALVEAARGRGPEPRTA